MYCIPYSVKSVSATYFDAVTISNFHNIFYHLFSIAILLPAWVGNKNIMDWSQIINHYPNDRATY